MTQKYLFLTYKLHFVPIFSVKFSSSHKVNKESLHFIYLSSDTFINGRRTFFCFIKHTSKWAVFLQTNRYVIFQSLIYTQLFYIKWLPETRKNAKSHLEKCSWIWQANYSSIFITKIIPKHCHFPFIDSMFHDSSWKWIL